MRHGRLGVLAALVTLAACWASPAGPLNPASVPVVTIGFEGQTDTFPFPGGIVPVLVRATVSEPSGANARSWSIDPAALERWKTDVPVGYVPPGPRTRFAFSLGSQVLNVPLSRASASSPGVDLVAAPRGGTLVVDTIRADREVWVEVSIAFAATVDGHPAHVEGTYGFFVELDPDLRS
jgi:hypothetical protein